MIESIINITLTAILVVIIIFGILTSVYTIARLIGKAIARSWYEEKLDKWWERKTDSIIEEENEKRGLEEREKK